MLVKKEEFRSLSTINEFPCISLFIPTHRAGFNNKQIDFLRFKNALSEARSQLETLKVTPNDINQLLEPAYACLENDHFWHQLSDGLAFFLSKDKSCHYELPISFNSKVYIGESFYLRPLLPLYTGDGRFFLLALSQQNVRFFEGSRHSISSVIIEDLVPEDLKEALGAEQALPSIQFHSGSAAGHRPPMYHGQGSGKEDKQEELKNFFRQIDDGLMKMLHDEQVPLVIAAVEYLVPIYKEISQYSYIVDPYLKGNPEHLSPYQLHESAWKIMAPYFKKEQKADFSQFQDNFSKDKGSISTQSIIPAAAAGRIQSLFINKDEDHLMGQFFPKENRVKVGNPPLQNPTCLLNFAAVQTFLQGGRVYNVSEEEMPFPHATMNAIFRY